MPAPPSTRSNYCSTTILLIYPTLCSHRASSQAVFPYHVLPLPLRHSLILLDCYLGGEKYIHYKCTFYPSFRQPPHNPTSQTPTILFDLKQLK